VVEVQMKTTEMRERRSALLMAAEKAPAREAKLVTSAIRDEYDTTRAAAIGMSPAGSRASDGDYSELAKRGEGLPRR
jgi:hypothetical protein